MHNPHHLPLLLAAIIPACYEGLTPSDPDTAGASAPESSNELSACGAGERVPCYDGPDGTRDVGRCRAGVRVCGPDGRFGACEAAVLPVRETCDTPEDDDCNGTNACGDFDEALVLQSSDDPVAMVAAETHVYLAWQTQGAITIGRFPADGAPPLALGPGVTTGALRLAVDPASDDLLLGATLDGALGLAAPTAQDCVTSDNPDVLLARFSPALDLLASRCIGDDTVQRLTDLDIYPDGAVLVAGTFDGVLAFPDGAPPPLDKAGGHSLTFAVRLAPNFTAVDWARSLDLGALLPDEPPQVAAAPDGGAVVYGTVRDGFDDHGGSDVFLSAYNPGGELRWTRRFGNSGPQRALALDIGPDGDLWIAGETAGPIDFDAPHVGDDAPVLTFLAHLDLDTGTPLAHRHLAGAGLIHDAGAQAIAVDRGGEIVLAGYAFAELSLGRTPPPAGGRDFFLAKLGADAAPIWHHRRGDDDDQFGFAVVRGAHDDLLVAAQFQGELEIGHTSLTAAPPTVLVARFFR